MKIDMPKHYAIFSDDITDLILNYIRKNIYNKYPYKKLSKSSLLKHFNFHRKEKNVEYLTGGNGFKLAPYKIDVIYELYFKDEYIANVDYIDIKLFNKRNDNQYLKLRSEQARKFK